MATALRTLGRENEDELKIPGTVQLIDLTSTVQRKHSLARKQQDIVLVPTPSDDPDDPLNFSRRRKLLNLACVVVYVFFTGLANSLIYAVLVPLSDATGLTVSNLNAGTGYLFLLAGWGLLFWQPFALQYGKRLTYLVSTAAVLAITMWAPYAQGNGQWIAKNVLGGFFVAPSEALPEISVSDLFFTHERGTYMAVYSFALAGSNYMGPVISGFINDGQGWRWVFYYPSIFLGAAFIFLFFFMEETNYDRKPLSTKLAISLTEKSAPSDHEKARDATATENTPFKKERLSTHETKSYMQKLSLRDKPRPQRMLYRSLLSLRLISWPVVLYAGVSYGSYLIWFNVMNATASIILGGPPYNFSTSIVGLCYLAALLGVVAGALFTGYISDWMTLRLVRRNGGVFEPEQRLWGFALTTIVLPAGLILWGVGAAHHIHWFGLIVAIFGIAFCNSAGITLSVNYLIDSYRDIGGDGITSIIIVRNTMGFAVSYGITPWIENLGYQNCFISAAFISLAVASLFLLVIWKGKSWREAYREKYWALVKRHIELGMLH